MKLTLTEWAEKEYKTPPSKTTLTKWAKTNQIHPTPQKHGRTWMVDECARYVGLPENNATSNNPLVNRIFSHGRSTSHL